jgi:hypothetical protein
LHVEEEQVHLLPADDFEGLFAICGLQRLKAAVSQHARHRLAKIAIVVGDQEAWREKLHGGKLSRGRRAPAKVSMQPRCRLLHAV